MDKKPASQTNPASSASAAKKGTAAASPKAPTPDPKSTAVKKVAGKTESASPGPKLKNKPAPKPPEPGPWRKWAFGAGLLVLVLGVGAGVLSALRDSPDAPSTPTKKGKKGKGPAPQKVKNGPDSPGLVKQPANPGTQTAAKPPDKKPGGKAVPPPEPIVKPKSKDITRLTLARLATEYATDAAETNRKYHASILEVSGRYDKQEQRAIGGRPARAHIIFRAEGRPLACSLEASPPTEVQRWNSLKPGEPITVRGVYGKDLCLHGCELLPYKPPAEVRYRGKKMELVGLVRVVQDFGEFPSIRFERATDSLVDVLCLFPKSERDNVKRVQPGTTVTVQGTCNGRTGDVIRMDNCKLVDTTAPEPPIERVAVLPFLRAYEEDLRLILPPQPEEQPALEVAVEQLGAELAAGPKSIDKKYRHRVLSVTGLLREKVPLSSTVILETGKTDQVVKVHCAFTKRSFQALPEQKTYHIRGVCTGMINATTLRLDNCEAIDASIKKDTRRLTADFFPHTPGQNQTYDLARLARPSPKGNREVIRQVFVQREDGLIETLTYRIGTLNTHLFDERANDWVHWRGTKKPKSPLPGPVYRRRVSGGFVEVGAVAPTSDGKGMTTVWEPVLKLGAAKGATWKWSHNNLEHAYKVLEFEEKEGRLSVIIQEMVRDPQVFQPVEVRHVFVRGVGEVERREWRYLSSQDKQLLMEKKLVEESEPEPVKPMPRKEGKLSPEPAKKP